MKLLKVCLLAPYLKYTFIPIRLTHALLVFYYICYPLKDIHMTIANIFLAIGPWQIAIVVLVVLLLFGGKKIPELMRGLGSGIKEFKNASKEDEPIEDKKE